MVIVAQNRDINLDIHQIDDPELADITQTQFNNAFSVFKDQIQGTRQMCLIYDAYEGPDESNHNCLGCNLDEMTDQVLKTLYTFKSNNNLFLPQQAFSIYVLQLNSIWEGV